MRLHAHGPGRLQRRARRRRFGRAPFHGHDRGRQVAARPGSRLDAGDQGASSASTSSRTSSAASSTAIPTARVHQKAFAGQTFDRTVHKGDLTGIEIINRLAEQVWARGIGRLEEHRAVELIRTADGSAIAGVLMIDMRDGDFVFVQAKAVLLATGGGPTMYKYHTPSGDKSCDGLAMALRAGLPLRDMEMVQFHPTGLLAGAHTRMTGTVLEEGLRGAGGYLLNGDGERFMHNYDPRGERATRDIVSRAMYRRDARRPHHARTAASTSSMRHLGAGQRAQAVQGHGRALRRLRLRSRRRPGRSRADRALHDGRRRVRAPIARPRCTASSPPAKTRAACTAPTGSAATASPTRRCSAASPATCMAAGCRAKARCASPTQRAIDAAIARCRAPLRACRAGDARAAARGALRRDVGRRRHLAHAAGLQRALVSARRSSTRSSTRIGVADGDRAFNLTWHDWLNLKSLIEVSRAIAPLGAGARGFARRAFSRGPSRHRRPRPRPMSSSAGKASSSTIERQAGPLHTRLAPGQSLLGRPAVADASTASDHAAATSKETIVHR